MVAGVTIILSQSATVTGIVLNSEKKPLKGVLIALWASAGWFVPEQCAKTDAEGRFRLPGEGEQVSVFHGSYSTSTVDVKDTARIPLQGRSTIQGELRNERGEPRPGEQLTLNRVHQVTTDSAGRFLFAGSI